MIRRYLLSLSAFLLFALSSASAYAIGVSPSTLFVDNLLTGQTLEQQVMFSRGDSSSKAVYTLTVEGSEAAYVNLLNGEQLVFEEGENQVRVPLEISSGKLATGTYKVSLHASPSPIAESANSEGTGTRVLSGVRGRVEFSVSNEAIEEYSISSITMGESEVGQALGFSFLMNNTGNVDTRPGRIELELVDVLDPSNTYSETIEGEDLHTIPAFSNEDIHVLTRAEKLAVANYNTQFKFFNKKGELIYETDAPKVQVFPEGTLSQEGELVRFETSKALYEPGEMVQISSSFRNVGTVGAKAAVAVEIYKDGEIVEIFKDDAIYTPMDREVEFDYQFTPVENGTYIAKAYGTYGVFDTEVQEIEFSVNSMNIGFVIGVLIALAGLIGIAVVWAVGRKKDSGAAPAPAAAPAPQNTPPTPPAPPAAPQA